MKNYKVISIIVLAFTLSAYACKESKKMANQDKNETTESSKPKPKAPQKSVIVDPTYMHKTTDSYTLLESRIKGDNLILLVQYGGGCETHQWELKTNGAYAKSLPPQITLNLEHNSNNDLCRALLTDTLEFNIKDIQYPGTFEVLVKLHNFEKNTITYKYN